jgi:hypothetical protein
LDWVFDGSRSDNLIKVVMEALMISRVKAHYARSYMDVTLACLHVFFKYKKVKHSFLNNKKGFTYIKLRPLALRKCKEHIKIMDTQ